MYFFSENYRDARKKFHTVCRSAGLTIDSCINPHAIAPTGEELAMDVVWCGDARASRVILVTCGTHGLEAAPGSATILQWIASGAHLTLPGDVAMMIVHGVNAYGWAWDSRTNEDNIDLNRNFLNHQKPKAENCTYEALHEQLLGGDMTDSGLAATITKYHAFAENKGANGAIHGITGGQYAHPDGISYGGRSLSWSCETLIQQVRNRLSAARKVVTVDWHTGIGDFAQAFLIIREPRNSALYQRAAEWWGESNLHSDDIFGDSGSPDYSGLLIDGLTREIQACSGADVLSVGIEWGTYGLDSMLQALFIDRWLRFTDTNPKSDRSSRLRTRLVERFYPSMPEWRNSVLKHSARIYRETISGLDNW